MRWHLAGRVVGSRMGWALGRGILGAAGGEACPKAPVTRGELALALRRAAANLSCG